MSVSIILKFLIDFLSNHQILAYLILFLSSFFETIIGFSFFVYGEIFFLAGSILAGVGILNIWLVILTLYSGGLLGDSTSYFLGKKYGLRLYKYFEDKIFFKKYINQKNYLKRLKFFNKYGGYSVFFARFLGPLSWITPFLAGIHKLKYKIFLKYDIPAVILGIGQFIIVGYFAGIHYKVLLNLFFKYSFILLFICIILIFLYHNIKKKKYISKFKKEWKSDKKELLKWYIKNFIWITSVITIIFFIFLFYISFDYNGHTNSLDLKTNRSILLNNNYLNNCNNLDVFYFNYESNIIQQINVILISDKNISNILDGNWIKNEIFNKDPVSLNIFIKCLRNKTLPVTNAYMNNISQDVTYQYKSNSALIREHIRFWKFNNESNISQKIYMGSISKDNGISFELYNYFLTPVHEINQNIDKSRDFFYNYLLNQNNLNINCKYIQTNCKIKKLDEDQQYYTNGKILVCKIK